jgi:hypothetical protein
MQATSVGQLDDWQAWCEFRAAATATMQVNPASDSASERHLVRNIAQKGQAAEQKAICLRSLVELSGLTIRQVSSYFNIEPEVVVRAISLLIVPPALAQQSERPKSKRRRSAA